MTCRQHARNMCVSAMLRAFVTPAISTT